MVRVEGELFRLGSPALADELVGCEALECLQSSTKIVGADKVLEMLRELFVAVVVVPLHGCFLDGAVHSLDLSVGPGMIDLGEAVLDAVLATAHTKHVGGELRGRAFGIARGKAELDAVVGQYCMDLVRHSRDQRGEEGRRSNPVGFVDQLDEGEFASAVNADKEEQFALCRLHLGNVDVEVADRVGFELLFGGLVAFDIRQPSDAMPLQTPMQRRSGQMRQCCLQRVEAIVERQQRMLAERHDDSFILDRQDGRAAFLWASWQVGDETAPPPLGNGFWVDAVALGQRP